eukprot:765875-Hanusia_phi.AAC.1
MDKHPSYVFEGCGRGRDQGADEAWAQVLEPSEDSVGALHGRLDRHPHRSCEGRRVGEARLLTGTVDRTARSTRPTGQA